MKKKLKGGATSKYNPATIEPKWQKKWEKEKLYVAKEKAGKKKFYGLIEFPYPSGDGLHVGHIRSNTAMDIICRKRRREGFEVLYPIGWDAFGLPTENYAIKTGIQPSVVTKKNTDTFRKQLKALGFSFDWSREVNTTDPKYYRWTQWIFLQLLKNGLAYKKKMTINWCPKDLIGLANEEVVNGRCERCGTPVEKREKEQWMLAITKYAERLDRDLDDVDYLPKIKTQQRNWIGKSEGAEIDFRLTIKNSKTRFVILHGFDGGATTDFHPWLKEVLEKRGHEVELPELPNAYHPKEAEQVEYVLKNCKLDENTVIVAHSLGAVVAMKALMKLNKPISGLVLVAAAVDPKFDKFYESRPFAKEFDWKYDYALLQKLTGGKVAVLSDLKEKHRSRYLKFLAEKLNARFVETSSVEEHFCAKEEPEVLKAVTPSIKVFTTRPDTLFGATYMVLAPENPWVKIVLSQLENKTEVEAYIAKASHETEIERTDATKEKTGVELKGVKAVNPANNEEIPVWIADYVLSDYGTGAIMAVPAHDERDWEFAKKFGLPIRHVVIPQRIGFPGELAFRPNEPVVNRRVIRAVVKHWSDNSYAVLTWKDNGWKTFISGGIEEGEDPVTAAKREIFEEIGYKNAEFVGPIGGPVQAKFYAPNKKQNRIDIQQGLLFKLKNDERVDVSPDELKIHEMQWLPWESLGEFMKGTIMDSFLFERLNSGNNQYFIGSGILIDSGQFSGRDSESAMKEITESVGGKWVTKYKLRDWVFSRQRYWGEPIPVVHCDACEAKDPDNGGWVPIPEKDLPVKLPVVKNYKPTQTGESPLAAMTKWVNVKCPVCKGPAKRETDTMPNWAGSSWYYLRYVDPKNATRFADSKKLKYWTPVDWYNGGMEHTTLHLLYSRFWHKFLFDQGVVPTSEPYTKRTSHGLILAEFGVKMSKSKGNVVNPDTIVKAVGADALRVYEMFMGPFDQPIAWDTDNIAGSRRFIERVWNMRQRITGGAAESSPASAQTDRIIHKTIKKVGDDIEAMRFNTAISSLMILVNELEKQGGGRREEEVEIPAAISRENFEILLKLLAPFAPHVTEELWVSLGNKKSIHWSDWPAYDASLAADDEVKIIVQVNGKVRGSFMAKQGAQMEDLERLAKGLPEAKKWLEGKQIGKVIVVPNRLVNIVLTN